MAKLCPFFDSVIKTLLTRYLENRLSWDSHIWHMAWDQCLDDLINYERIPWNND